MDLAKTTARRERNIWVLGFGAWYIRGLTAYHIIHIYYLMFCELRLWLCAWAQFSPRWFLTHIPIWMFTLSVTKRGFKFQLTISLNWKHGITNAICICVRWSSNISNMSMAYVVTHDVLVSYCLGWIKKMNKNISTQCIYTTLHMTCECMYSNFIVNNYAIFWSLTHAERYM